MAVAAFVLPSALNLRQANPTETEQFAPVPSADHSTPQALGNLSSLALGTSASLSADGAGGDGPGGTPAPPSAGPSLPPPLPPVGTGAVPDQYPCVGDPPRQTDDPLSPPCVAYYQGNNGGSTYQGVTANRITVLIYADGTADLGTSDGTDENFDYEGRYFDLAKPIPADVDSDVLRNYQRFQKYFNYHYATYNRFVDFVVYFATCSGGNCATTGVESPATREADAAANYAKYHPFAVVTSWANLASADSYEDYMASKGVLVFGSYGLKPASFFRQYPDQIWDFDPTLERQAATFSYYVCQKVVGQPVVDSGNAGANGKPRVLGLITMTDPDWPNLTKYGSLVKSQVEACGGKFAATGTVPMEAGSTVSTYPEEDMAALKQAKVTTVIWPGGTDDDLSKAAAALDYYPEWIIGGDGQFNDEDRTATAETASVWAHAWLVTFWAYRPPPAEQLCREALDEVDPNTGQDGFWGCISSVYDDLRQLFTGIQVAGPNLTPASINEGFHAIPAIASSNPQVPACFYPADDYTCVQDSVVEHWNPKVDGQGNYVGGTNSSGCWLMLGDGQRTLDGNRWPAGNINAQYQDTDVCNDFS